MDEVRCPTDNKLWFVPSDDFTGHIGGKCQGKCRADFEYPADDTVATAKLFCPCGLWVARGNVETGSVQTFCRRERVLIRLTPEATIYLESPIEKPKRIRPNKVGIRRPSSPVARLRDDEILAAIERRWETLRLDNARRSAEIAVGLRFDVFSRDGFKCRYCGRGPDQGVYLEADHVVPRSKGGLDTMANLVTSCWDCNRGKSAKLLDEKMEGMRIIA